MDEYIAKLENLLNNFSYQELNNLLKELDTDILEGKIHEVDSKFLRLFEQVMNLADDKNVTFGHTLVENSLVNKKKLTPTLMMYYYLEQKGKIGLESSYNKVLFSRSDGFKMAAQKGEDIGELIEINLNAYERITDIDEFNYEIMHDLIHETTHVYQDTRSEFSEDLFERLVYYDKKCMDITTNGILGGTNGGNAIVHESFVSEFMADEQADSYMLRISREHPEYFNSTLIKNRMDYYQNKRAGKGMEFYANPRAMFAETIGYLKDTYRRIIGKGSLEAIQPVLDEIEIIKQKSKPIIEQLKSQGISENPSDNYYNIFLDCMYHFDGQEIVIIDETKEKDEYNKEIDKIYNNQDNNENFKTNDKNEHSNDENNSSLTLKQRMAQFLRGNSVLMKIPFVSNFVDRQLNVLPPPANVVKKETLENKSDKFENWLSNNGEYRKLLANKSRFETGKDETAIDQSIKESDELEQ